MSLNQAHILESLEKICRSKKTQNFIYDFLLAYGLPKSTVARLRNEDASINAVTNGDVALKKKVYFHAASVGEDLQATAAKLLGSPVITTNSIRFIIVTDFDQLVAYDTLAEDRLDVAYADLPKSYSFFLPLSGYEKAVMHSEHPADVKAADKMGRLFDLIKAQNKIETPEQIHALNVFLTRLLFCFYAEDTGIFNEGQMSSAIASTTSADGSDVDQFFGNLFKVLNLSPTNKDRANLPMHLQSFPYVNGGLFANEQTIPVFNAQTRRILLDCGALDWSEINPDIFGSMFQSVIDETQRSNLGQHYTSVPNIMKVIKPLFLDYYYAELDKAKSNPDKLKVLLAQIQSARFFDPACGSGNFLIIAYKELRHLEMLIIDALNASSLQPEMYHSGIRLSQFYGIEYDDFAHEIAILSLWLTEHQMNMAFKAKFGYAQASLPLKESGNIVCGDSLQLDWKLVCPRADKNGKSYEIYIIGNPPFLGTVGRTDSQTVGMKKAFCEVKSTGSLDLVAAWVWLAAKYIKGFNVKAALVTTNSICQGTQVSLLWPSVFDLGVVIDFAYQTFAWSNSAKAKAAVHVIIVALKNQTDTRSIPKLFYNTLQGVLAQPVKSISPYLIEGSRGVVSAAAKPLSASVNIRMGSMPCDGGHLLLSTSEKNELLQSHPEAAQYVRKFIGSEEFINSKERWCLWLLGHSADDFNDIPFIAGRINQVRATRLSRPAKESQECAATPHLFARPTSPQSGNYLVIPQTCSERRTYLPLGFLPASTIASNLTQIIPNATPYEFAILNSEMHNDWMRLTSGRLKSDYRYSSSMTYNTFVWPTVTEAQKQAISLLGEEIILIREDYPEKSLAQLYDPNLMPASLLAAHKALDAAVERLYRTKPFKDTAERLTHLMGLYEQLVAAQESKSKKPTKAKKAQGVSTHG